MLAWLRLHARALAWGAAALLALVALLLWPRGRAATRGALGRLRWRASERRHRDRIAYLEGRRAAGREALAGEDLRARVLEDEIREARKAAEAAKLRAAGASAEGVLDQLSRLGL